MNIVVLSLSYSLDDKLDGVVGSKILEIAGTYHDPLFVLERKSTIEQFLSGYRSVIYTPVFTMFDSKAQAFMDRNERMVKYGTECYCFMDIDDRGMYPLSVAHHFSEKHPGYLVKVFVHADGVLKEIGLKRAKELFKWKMEMSEYK